MRVAETFIVTQTGIGKPDYSREISLGQMRPGIRLKYNQTLRLNGLVFSNIPSPYSWVFAPLAIGATAHIVDQATGLPLPYTVPAGYTYSLIQRMATASEDRRIDSYIDGGLVMLTIVASGYYFSEKDILGLSTIAIDPTGAIAHTVDNTVTNLGGAPLEGGFGDVVVMEAVGTPPMPKTKVIKCKWCDYTIEIPIETNRLNCPKCHKLTLYYISEQLRTSA